MIPASLPATHSRKSLRLSQNKLSAIQIAKPERKMASPTPIVRTATVPAVRVVVGADGLDLEAVGEGERGTRRLGWLRRPRTTAALQHMRNANVDW
jgi:hypothetical protein